jgi:glycerol uptake facilitator-like aquaporin
MRYSLGKRAIAEAVGTAFLLCAIVGSGIALTRIAAPSGVAGIAGMLVVGATFVAIIQALGPISGAHFNPAVTLGDALLGGTAWRDVPAYVGAQLVGAVCGVVLAHGMFGYPLLALSHVARSTPATNISEVVAAFGLILVIAGCVRANANGTYFAVAGYLGAASWFTASGAFANPAVTLARILTSAGSGIAPLDALWFVLAQFAGAACAAFFVRYVLSAPAAETRLAVIGHASQATWRVA